MNIKEKILENSLEFLRLFCKDFKEKGKLFTCPECGELSCNFIPYSNYKLFCLRCNKNHGNIIEYLMTINGDVEEFVIKEIANRLKLIYSSNDETKNILDFYEKSGFDLVKIIPNGKIPIEGDWLNKEHKNRSEWEEWLKDGFNIGIKTGEKSGITVIDFESKDLPALIVGFANFLCVQETNKGLHLFFKYDEDLPNVRVIKYENVVFDIENDGGQVIASPSKINNFIRKIEYTKQIQEIPKELKELLLKAVKENKREDLDKKYDMLSSEESEFKLMRTGGGRHNVLMSLGGAIRKQCNIQQTEYLLNLIDQNFTEKALGFDEIRKTIMRSLGNYMDQDERELTAKILEYLRIVEESSRTDLELTVFGKFLRGDEKKKLDELLRALMVEGLVIKRGKTYKILSKANWKDTFVEESKILDFKVPYFHDYAICRNGDLIIIGAKTGSGKTHVAMNIVKDLVKQGIKPYYIPFESGGRFAIISQQLGLKEKDFFWDLHFSPEHIELEKNAVTIIDWLLPKDYAETDKIYEYLAKQLARKGGLLIVFAQLRENGNFFACVDKNTEALTETGWKKYNELLITDKIACMNLEKNELIYSKCFNINKYNYSGELYCLKNKYMEQFITPNHNIITKRHYRKGRSYTKQEFLIDKKWQKIKIQNLKFYDYLEFLHSNKLNSNINFDIDLAELIGWFISEGNIDRKKYIRLSQKNIEGRSRVEFLLNKLKISYRNEDTGYYLHKEKNKSIYNLIFKYFPTRDFKRPSWNLLHLNYECLERLYLGLVGGDGSRKIKNHQQFYQKSKYVVDWFRVLCTHLGYRTTVRLVNNTNYISHKEKFLYHIQITFKNNSIFKKLYKKNKDNNNCDITKINYNDIVWCPTTITGNWIAKRNDKIFLTGNSDMIKFFPAVVAKFFQDEQDVEGKCGYFITEKIRESKNKRQMNKILTEYSWDTCELKIKET